MSVSLEGTADVEEVRRKRMDTIKLLDYANRNRNAGIYNDVQICTGNNSFPANRLVLSCFSPYFEKMFQMEMKEKYEKSVKIECIDSDSMKSLIDFIYTGNITISIKNVCKLLSGSDYLQIKDVKTFCFDFIQEAITLHNCFNIIEIADSYCNDVLKEDAIRFISETFEEVTTTAHFKNFSKAELTTFISQQDTKKVPMTSLYKAVLGWTKHKENRVDDLPDILHLVELHALPYEFLEEVVNVEELILNNHACTKMLLKAFNVQLKQSRSDKTGSRILSLGGENTLSNVLEVYNNSNVPSQRYPDLPEGRSAGCAVNFNNHVYFIGGQDASGAADDRVWRLNLLEKELKWDKFHSMQRKWSVMGAAVFEGNLVIVGSGGEKSGEFFSTISRRWKSMPELQLSRDGNALVSCGNRLYALGGYGGSSGEYLSSVECLLSFDGKWECVTPMQTPRRWLAAVSCDGFIYAIGGSSDDDYKGLLKTVERYDPDRDEWSYVSDMNFKRDSLACCVLQGQIFVVGGLGEEGLVVNEIECYNPLIDKWNIVGKTDDQLFYHSLIVL